MANLYFKFFVLFFLFLNHSKAFAQGEETLNPEERAYLFHVVKKSPILEQNFGRYFEYKGPEILLTTKELNYDSMELVIINNPELLVIRKSEIAKSAPGLIAEAANKMAIWELNKMLLAQRVSTKELEPYLPKFNLFQSYLISKLPEASLRKNGDVLEVQPKVFQALNAGLSFNEKVAILESNRQLSQNDVMLTVEAMNFAINSFVQKRAYEIYLQLGGISKDFRNVLIAAGDGSTTSGLLEEREKDERGRWNKGLPKAVGLFPYDFKLVEIEDKSKGTEYKIEPLTVAILDFKTADSNLITNLHFDVWGYNSEKQTTVVVEKNSKSYRLFGSGETRFLSPDSAFAEGKTYQNVIDELQNDKIAKLHEMIYGKKGFDYWIDYNIKKRDETELKIEKTEKKTSDMGYTPITTSSNSSRKVKKARKKNKGGGPVDYKPTTSSNKGSRGKKQSEIVGLYNAYEGYKLEIIQLKKDKKEAVDLMAIYQRKLDEMKQNFGLYPVAYTEKDGFYMFEDSTTFDIFTQEFRFPKSKGKEDFEVRLLAIPNSSLGKSADEVMLHINEISIVPGFDSRVNLALLDVFNSNSYQLDYQLFKAEDSVSVLQFFEAIQDKDLKFELIARGQGIGSWDGNRTIRDNQQVSQESYNGNPKDSTYLRLRKSEVMIDLNRKILVEVNSYTDPVKTNFQTKSEEFKNLQTTYQLSNNEVLSVYRTAAILRKMKAELNVLAGTYLSRDKAKIIIDKINSEIDKASIAVGRTSIKLSEVN